MSGILYRRCYFFFKAVVVSRRHERISCAVTVAKRLHRGLDEAQQQEVPLPSTSARRVHAPAHVVPFGVDGARAASGVA